MFNDSITFEHIGGIEYLRKYLDVYLPYIIITSIGSFVGIIGGFCFLLFLDF
jgi:hypothetical protein